MATAPSSTEHIEKCGYLKIKRPPSSGKVRFKAWQSKYFVLRGSPPIFEYFKDELSYHMTRGNKEINRISLENVIHIGTTDASKTQRNAFMIVSPHGALMLASDNEQDAKEWVEVLNRVAIKPGTSPECPPDLTSLVYPEQSPPVSRRSVPNASSSGSPVLGVDPGLRRASDPPVREANNQGFLVTTRLTPSSEKNGIRGMYRMHITDEHVVLHQLDSNVLFISWPLVDLRGWKCESAESAGRHGTQLLTLESGRKSATGVGLFQFFTHSGNEIAAKIRAHSNVIWESAVKKREKFKYDRSSSFEDLANPSYPPGETIKKALTEPQPSSSQKQAQLSNSVPRAESDSLLNFHKIERPKLSPNSLRKTLLQGMCMKDAIETKDTESTPVKEDVDSIAQPTDNTYLDLISESGVEPVHISDPEHRRTSTNSEEGAVILKSRIPSINESSEQSDYIDERELNTYEENRRKSFKVFESDSQDDESYSDATVTLKSSETTPTSKQTPATPDTQFFQDFFDQLSNPTAHKTSIFPQHQSQLKSSHHIGISVKQELDRKETSSDTILTSADLNGKSSLGVVSETSSQEVISLTTNVQSNEGFENIDPEELAREDIVSPNDIEFVSGSIEHVRGDHESFHNLLKRSDETQDLLQKCLFQLQSPQTFAKQDLFPNFPKQNSTGNATTNKMSGKKVNEGKHPRVKSLTVSSELGSKKIIEKSNSHSGFDSKIPSDRPPPLPVRRELTGRTRSSASMGDIFEGVQRRPEQFPKGINRQHSPLNPHTPAFGASCGPESLVSARLLQRTTSGSNLVLEKKSSTHLAIQEPQEVKLSMSDLNRPRSSSLRSSGHSTSHSYEDDKNNEEGDGSKRRGSKASKFLNKVLNNFSLSPVMTTKRRASCDCLGPDAVRDVETRARSGSAMNPGIDNEGWSPETSLDVPTPEGSPKHFRKSSSALRRASHDPSLGRRSFFVGSPTFDNRDEMRERAKERERERAELPKQPPPALPPRKKSDPPPLPPRRRKSSGDHSCPSSPPCRTGSGEHPQSPAVKTSSSKGSSTRGALVVSSHDGQASPPPIPPRREERRGSHPPSIQLTLSSPENKDLNDSLDGLEEEPMPTSSVEDVTSVGKDSSEVPVVATGPPTISSILSKNTDVTCPVPKRPAKTKRQWTRQQSIDLVDSTLTDEEISGPRNLILERKQEETSQGSCEETIDSAFISVGVQERVLESQVHERLEVSEIELDSVTNIIQSETREIRQSSHSVPSRPDVTDGLTPPLLPTSSTLGGTPGKCSPGHSPTHSLNMPNRGSGLVLGDSGSTTPISV